MLVPLADILTPNLPEAAALLDEPEARTVRTCSAKQRHYWDWEHVTFI